MATWFLAPGFSATPIGDPSNLRHRRGGAATHRGAACPSCDRNLLLLWTLDCRDERITAVAPREDSSEDNLARFRALDQLPIYYCWRCSQDFTYLLRGDAIAFVDHSSPEEFEPFEPDPEDDLDDVDTEFPYDDYPEQFPETPLQLTPLEVEFEAHRVVSRQEPGFLEALGSAQPEADIDPPPPLQFGGLPPLTQGIEGFNCRNENCDASAEDDEWTPDGLRVLAAGREDSDFPMVTRDGSNPFVQVVALICPECLGLRVVNQCD